MSKKIVGVSNRTCGKHAALDRFLGRTAGVMLNNFLGKRIWIVDCTAGDGKPSEYSDLTSPEIVLKHAQWMRERGVDVNAVFYEQSDRNVVSLKQLVGERFPVIHGNATEMPCLWRKDDVLVILNDPNSVADWALPKSLDNAPALTTVFSTLGCNVGGLKRMPPEKRAQWYEQVECQLSLLRNHHDALLVTLDGDASQWAYLVNAPAKHRAEVAKDFNKGFESYSNGLSMAWLKENEHKFYAMEDFLFKTGKEFAGLMV